MGDIIQIHNGKRVIFFDAFFLEDGTYVELMETEDLKKYIGSCKPKDYPPDVRDQAIELGVIDKKGRLIQKSSQE